MGLFFQYSIFILLSNRFLLYFIHFYSLYNHIHGLQYIIKYVYFLEDNLSNFVIFFYINIPSQFKFIWNYFWNMLYIFIFLYILNLTILLLYLRLLIKFIRFKWIYYSYLFLFLRNKRIYFLYTIIIIRYFRCFL